MDGQTPNPPEADEMPNRRKEDAGRGRRNPDARRDCRRACGKESSHEPWFEAARAACRIGSSQTHFVAGR